MRLLISPAAVSALETLSNRDATRLLTRLGVVAMSPNSRFRWRDLFIVVPEGDKAPEHTAVAVRVRHSLWHALARLDHQTCPGDVMVVDEVLANGHDEAADRVFVEAAAAHEQAVGKDAARTGHLPREEVHRMLGQRGPTDW